MRQYDYKLVPADTRDRVAVTQCTRQPPGEFAQHVISHGMPQRVVDVLETVQIQKHHRHLPALPARMRQRLRKSIMEQATVG